MLVVPAAPGLFDYYDRFLGHERRYARGELAGKLRDSGLRVLADVHLGSLLYPPFWLSKKRNRLMHADLRASELAERVERDIARTRGSVLGRWACCAERSCSTIAFACRSASAI